MRIAELRIDRQVVFNLLKGTREFLQLRRFAGVANLPAVPRRLSPRELAAYEGRYFEGVIDTSGRPDPIEMDLTGDNGQLRMVRRESGQSGTLRLAFYRKDHVLADVLRVVMPSGNGCSARSPRDFWTRTSFRWLRCLKKNAC